MRNALALLLLAAPAAAEPALSPAFQSARAMLAARSLPEVTIPREHARAPSKEPAVLCRPAPENGSLWRKVQNKACLKGAYRPADGMIPATMGLEDIKGGRQETHVSDYVNLWGWTSGEDVFAPDHATFVSEHWVLKGDRFHIDQWILWSDLEGKLTRVMHGYLVEDVDGRVYDSGGYPAELGDPATKEKHAALLAMWASFEPKLAGGEAPIRLLP